MRRIRSFMVVAGLASALLLPALNAPDTHAATFDLFKSCSGVDSEICKDQADQKLFGANSIWTRIINMLIFLIGSIAVIMIVVGGMRYVLSGGDSSAVNSAKNTILYAVVGLIVAVMAYAIVNFVVTQVVV